MHATETEENLKNSLLYFKGQNFFFTAEVSNIRSTPLCELYHTLHKYTEVN